MSDDSIPRSIALILLILSSGVFASLETAYAYAYVNHLHMKTLADDGDRSAARVVRILDRYDDAIVAVLIMINVLHVAASLIATLLAVDLIPLPESAASAVAAVLLTVVVFIFVIGRSIQLHGWVAIGREDRDSILFTRHRIIGAINCAVVHQAQAIDHLTVEFHSLIHKRIPIRKA